MKKSPKRVILGILGSLLLAIFISIMAILLSIRLGFISNKAILNSMNKVNYYGSVYEEFMSKCESIAIPNGLNREVFHDVISSEQLYSDGSEYLKAQLAGAVFQIDTEDYKKKLSDNIYAYVEKNDLTAEGNMEQIIESFCEEIMDYYVEIIRFPYGFAIGSIFRMIENYFLYVFIAMLLLALITIGILVKQNFHRKDRILRYMAYSTMSGVISTLIIPIFCMVTGFYKKLQIYPEYMYQFMINYIEHGMKVMLMIGMILFAVSLAFMEMSELQQKSV